MAREYPTVPKPTEPRYAYIARVVEAVNKLLVGRGNNIGTFNLAASPATTTTVLNNRVESGMTILLTPTTSAASTCDYYVSAVAKGSFTVTHLACLTTASFAYEYRG